MPTRQEPPWTRLVVGLLLLFSLFAALAGCVRDHPVVVASHVWVGYEPMFLARSLGWLDPDRVSLHETASASESLQALFDGRVDGAALTLDEVLVAREQGLALTVVLVFNVSAGADMLLARPPVRGLEDMAGQRVAFEHGAVGELLVSEALRRAGLSPSDIVALDVAVDRHYEAWQTGAADIVATYEPTASRLLEAGAINIFDSRELPDTIVDVLAVRTERLGRRQDAAITHLIESHLKALDHLHRNPQDASYRMAERLELQAVEVLRAYRGLVLPDLASNERLLRARVPALQETARGLLAFKRERGLIAGTDDLRGLIDGRYLPAEASR